MEEDFNKVYEAMGDYVNPVRLDLKKLETAIKKQMQEFTENMTNK